MPFESARIKLARAEQHLEAFEEAIERFRADDPYTITHESDPATGHHRFLLKIRKRPTNLMAVLAGDFAHNARSALDHVAWQLGGSNFADIRTQFPIFIDPVKFNAQHIAAIPKRAQTVVKWLQPYRRAEPKADPLWHLQALDIADKHKLLIPAIGIVEALEPKWPPIPPYTNRHWELEVNAGPFVEDAEIADLLVIDQPLDGSPPNTDVDVDCEFTPGVAIREPFSGITLLPAQIVLRDALTRAQEVVTMFERYL